MKVKRATFFYNTDLLNRVCSGESNSVIIGHGFTDTLSAGDVIKFIGEKTSVIVEVINIGPKDCNGNCKLSVKLLKVVLGELEIEY